MKKILVLLAFLLGGCFPASSPSQSPTASVPPSTPTLASVATVPPNTPTLALTATVPPSTPTPTQPVSKPLPPVEGPEPSYKVAAFYYPWYGNPTVDGQWIHWMQANYQPPQSISSDYYPALGAYSSNDPAVVAQHMAWLRQAGIGVLVTSWWGPHSKEDNAVPLILQMAERYRIQVAFHSEPYPGRTADRLVEDIKYIYQKYGDAPAFFRSTTATLHSPGTQPKGMFFVYCGVFGGQGECGKQPAVQPDFWQKALDEIHALPQGALVLVDQPFQAGWIDDGHFDGAYNYITLDLNQGGGFGWARGLPMGALYVPSVIPGNSARRIGYPESTYVPRRDGKTYNEQWAAALGTGVQPELVTITSFNEWHEGSMLEPPAVGATDGKGYTYANFGSLPPEGYLTLTQDWIKKYLETIWLPAYRVRIQIKTNSDWTTLALKSGGTLIHTRQVSASPEAINLGVNGNRFAIGQPIARATAGGSVELVVDADLTNVHAGTPLEFVVEKGAIGDATIKLLNYVHASPIEVNTTVVHEMAKTFVIPVDKFSAP